MKNLVKVLCVALCLMLVLPFALAEEKPVLKVGTNPEFAPFEYVGDDGEDAGFDIALIKAIGDYLGYDVEMVNNEFASLIGDLNSGKTDAIIAGMTATEERAKQVTFTTDYFTAYQVLIVKADSEFTAVTEGMKVGVQEGTTGDFYVTEILGETSSDVARYAKALDAVIDLENGRLDAVVVDEAPAQAYVMGYEDLAILTIEDTEPEVYAIAVDLNNTELADAINEALAALIEDGTYDALYQEYYVGYFGAGDAE